MSGQAILNGGGGEGHPSVLGRKKAAVAQRNTIGHFNCCRSLAGHDLPLLPNESGPKKRSLQIAWCRPVFSGPMINELDASKTQSRRQL
jgi:hypothetical protein